MAGHVIAQCHVHVVCQKVVERIACEMAAASSIEQIDGIAGGSGVGNIVEGSVVERLLVQVSDHRMLLLLLLLLLQLLLVLLVKELLLLLLLLLLKMMLLQLLVLLHRIHHLIEKTRIVEESGGGGQLLLERSSVGKMCVA